LIAKNWSRDTPPGVSAVGEGLDPPFDFAGQNQIAVRQFIVISFGNPENVIIFGREGQDPPLQFLTIDCATKWIFLFSPLNFLSGGGGCKIMVEMPLTFRAKCFRIRTIY